MSDAGPALAISGMMMAPEAAVMSEDQMPGHPRGQLGREPLTKTERSSSLKISSGTPEFFRLLARATMA